MVQILSEAACFRFSMQEPTLLSLFVFHSVIGLYSWHVSLMHLKWRSMNQTSHSFILFLSSDYWWMRIHFSLTLWNIRKICGASNDLCTLHCLTFHNREFLLEKKRDECLQPFPRRITKKQTNIISISSIVNTNKILINALLNETFEYSMFTCNCVILLVFPLAYCYSLK